MLVYNGWAWEYWDLGEKLADDAFSCRMPKNPRKIQKNT